jgi:hypothetical protein
MNDRLGYTDADDPTGDGDRSVKYLINLEDDE